MDISLLSLSEGELYFLIAAFCLSVYALQCYWTGMGMTKFKRALEDTPRCKINTGAVGTNVEIQGFVLAEKDKLVTAPLSGKKCAWFELEVWREGNSEIDARIFSDDGFYLDDDSGAYALLLLEGAEFWVDGNKSQLLVSPSKIEQIPKSLYAFLKANQKQVKSLRLKNSRNFTQGLYIFRERYLMPDECLYVFGFAESALKNKEEKKPNAKQYQQAKKILQKDEELQKQFDTNQDGELSYKEMEQGVRIIAEKLQGKFNQSKANEIASKTKMVFKKKPPHMYIISEKDEDELLREMGKRPTIDILILPVALMAWGGFVLYWFFTRVVIKYWI